jgi:transposase-like protein
MLCLCKQAHQSRWTRRNNFARIRRVAASGQIRQGNIRVHDRKRQRYRCTICKQTFSARRGTMFEGLRTASELIVIVVTLLAFGCPVQAIVQAYGLDERTVARLSRSRWEAVSTRASRHRRARTARCSPRASRRDPSESTGHGGVDGIGNDGLDASVAGWSGESHP